ncbi:GrpB family protein [Henriciella barbarensis]|uniref:GrpB family protein n=1 Tax=Henriciella barbarensis TaxID=86342 RepID=A0A399QSF8_9PROT|nr:GrpB family protein [Henriciella barbarensis]RIJ20447.1 GrpB family protein [Henriciella barbarensis]
MDEIEIAEHNPDWPAAFQRERERILSALADFPIIDIVHFGSTAIKGMPAKPIIDMLFIVPDLNSAKAALPAKLDRLGYDYWADNPKTDRLFFVRGMPPRGEKRTHHIHVSEPGSDLHGRLAFVDYLYTHPEEAEAYARLKRKLAETYGNDREAYTQAKSDFIDRVMMIARPDKPQ